jgi:predicted Zn-dependent protease
MNKLLLTVTLVVLSLASCFRNEVTGRKQLKFIPESQLRQLSVTEYNSFLTKNRIIRDYNNPNSAMVKRIGNKIAAAITQYYGQQGKFDVVKDYNWEFNLVDKNEINAWCMPGGKVVVYTGLLPVARNENALAVVMGHEIAHAVAGHGGERMSQAMIAQGLGTIGNIATSGNPSVNLLFDNIFGIGAQTGFLLPNSRKHELEADRFGLYFSAMAGYDPREAVPFWQRMAQAGGQKPPEFLATHPSDERRIQQLEHYMDEAIRYYNASLH